MLLHKIEEELGCAAALFRPVLLGVFRLLALPPSCTHAGQHSADWACLHGQERLLQLIT